MSVEIKLSSNEMMQAATVGIMRQLSALQKNRIPAHGAGSERDWQYHVEGAMGEFAVAKFYGCFWNGSVGRVDTPDVGALEVRTRSDSNYDLILHESDNDEAYFVLVTGKNGVYKLHGVIQGRRGKRPEFLRDAANNNRQAYFVPKSRLDPIW